MPRFGSRSLVEVANGTDRRVDTAGGAGGTIDENSLTIFFSACIEFSWNICKCYRKPSNRTRNRKPNRNLRNPNRLRFTKKPEKPEIEETETAVCKKWYLCTDLKWVKLNRAGVLVPTIRKRSARSTKWAWFQCLGFTRGLEEAGFLIFWFLWFRVLNQLERKQKIQTRPSLEFRISRLQENARIQKNSKIIKKKEEKREGGPGALMDPGPPSLFSSFFLIVFLFFWILAFS